MAIVSERGVLSLIIKVWLPVFAHLVLLQLHINTLNTGIKILGIVTVSYLLVLPITTQHSEKS